MIWSLSNSERLEPETISWKCLCVYKYIYRLSPEVSNKKMISEHFSLPEKNSVSYFLGFVDGRCERHEGGGDRRPAGLPGLLQAVAEGRRSAGGVPELPLARTPRWAVTPPSGRTLPLRPAHAIDDERSLKVFQKTDPGSVLTARWARRSVHPSYTSSLHVKCNKKKNQNQDHDWFLFINPWCKWKLQIFVLYKEVIQHLFNLTYGMSGF